jgi:hypothetical protein
MNKQTIKTIEQALSHVAEAKILLESATTQQHEYFDALSEEAQESEKGEASNDAIAELEQAIDYLVEAEQSLNVY